MRRAWTRPVREMRDLPIERHHAAMLDLGLRSIAALVPRRARPAICLMSMRGGRRIHVAAGRSAARESEFAVTSPRARSAPAPAGRTFTLRGADRCPRMKLTRAPRRVHRVGERHARLPIPLREVRPYVRENRASRGTCLCPSKLPELRQPVRPARTGPVRGSDPAQELSPLSPNNYLPGGFAARRSCAAAAQVCRRPTAAACLFQAWCPCTTCVSAARKRRSQP